MNKTTQKILFAVPIVVGLFLIVRHFTKGKKQSIPVSPDVPTPSPGNDIPAPSRSEFPLEKGSSGANVIRLQNALKSCNSSHLPKYGVDGSFGSETQTALLAETGKSSITEDQLTALENKCRTAAKTAVTNADRISLANKLISQFNKNPSSYNFYAIWEMKGGYGIVTADGREIRSGDKIWQKGDKIGFSRNATFKLDSQGFITAYDNGTFTYFSPYGSEVK